MQELERVQKRAMQIICPGIEYQDALALVNLPTVAKHHNDISIGAPLRVFVIQWLETKEAFAALTRV